MGDRTYVNLQVHPDDIKIEAFQHWTDQMGAPEYGINDGHYFYEEVNYAAYSDLEELAEAGVRFVGDHGSGGCYGAASFFHDGDGVVHYAPEGTWEENKIVVQVGCDGSILEENIKAQVHLLNRQNILWGEIDDVLNSQIPEAADDV